MPSPCSDPVMRPLGDKPEQGQQRAVGCLARLILAGYPLNNYQGTVTVSKNGGILLVNPSNPHFCLRVGDDKSES
jgi:hypothetical protein